MTLGNVLLLSGPPFPHLEMEVVVPVLLTPQGSHETQMT